EPNAFNEGTATLIDSCNDHLHITRDMRDIFCPRVLNRLTRQIPMTHRIAVEYIRCEFPQCGKRNFPLEVQISTVWLQCQRQFRHAQHRRGVFMTITASTQTPRGEEH